MRSPLRVLLVLAQLALVVGCGSGTLENIDLRADHGLADTHPDTGLLDQTHDNQPTDATGDGNLDSLQDHVPDEVPADLWTDVSADLGDTGFSPEQGAALKVLFPLATRFEAHKQAEQNYFQAFQGQELIGVAFEGRGWGFSSEIVTLTAVATKGSVALEVVSQWEMDMWWQTVTGSAWFWDQFRKEDGTKIGVATKDLDVWGAQPDYVDAVSGATVSSNGVIEGFWQALEGYLKYLESKN